MNATRNFFVAEIDLPICQNLSGDDVFLSEEARLQFKTTLDTASLRNEARHARFVYLVSWQGVRDPQGACVHEHVIARQAVHHGQLFVVDPLGNLIGRCEYRRAPLGAQRMLVFIK